ncbi:MAG: Calx-beta domain-containing protein [Pyrinomonadaceae bacterium]
MRTTKARVFVFLTLVILTAVFSANALTANASAATTDTAATQQSGFIASSFNNILSFFGLAEAAKPAADKTDGNGCDTAPEGLLACYRGDLDASDVKGVHNGEWVGVYGYATGKVGAGSFSFNGSNRIEVGNAPDLNPTNVTVDGWVNLSTGEGSFGLISKGDAYGLSVRGGHVVFSSRNAAGEIETLEGPTVKVGAWTHIAATHDGSMRRIYVDGKEVASGRQTGLFGGDESAMLIGNTTTTDAAFTGLADEVKVFNRALTAKEIAGIAGNRGDAINALALSVSPTTIAEGNNLITVSLTRSATAANAVSVNFDVDGIAGDTATSGVSCAAGVDFVWNASSIVFVANETGTKSITVQICSDTVAEGSEVFGVDVSSVVGGDPTETTFDTTAIVPVTITDDDSFTLGVNGPVNEGAANTTVGSDGTGAAPPPGSGNALTFAVGRGGASGPVSVGFTLSGTARFQVNVANQAADYSLAASGAGCTLTYVQGASTGTVNFGAGAGATCNIVATAYADDFVETNETVTVTLGTPPAGGVFPAAVTGTFNNDDNPWVSVNVTANQNDGFGRIYVEEGTPQTGAAAGALRYTFTRGLCAAATPGTPGGAGNAVCPGGDTAALPVGGANFTSNTGSATAPSDFTAPTSPISFAAGATSNFVDIDPTNDILVEPDEQIIVVVSPAGGAALNYNVDNTSAQGNPLTFTDTAVGFINDDDEDVSVTVAGSPTIEGGAPLVYTFTRTADSGGATPVNGIDPRADNIVVNFTLGGAVTAATCSDTSDYTLSAGAGAAGVTQGNCVGTVSINGGTNAAAVNATPTNDAIPENQENVLVTIVPNGTQYGVGSPNASGTNASANGVINNDDFQVIVTGASPASTLEDGATNLVYTFTRIGDNAPVVVANFNTSGSANPVTGPDFVLSGQTSYTPAAIGNSNGTITIPVGNSTTVGGVAAQTALLTADPQADPDVELDETIIVQVDNGAGYAPGTPAQATGVILNDDSVVSIAVAPTAVTEDGAGNLVYTFTRTGGCGSSLSVNYSTTGTATAGTDYTGTNAGANTVVFPAGQCSVAVTVDPSVDATPEPDETVILTITASSGAPNQYTIGTAVATGTITNDDTGVTVAVAPGSVAEDGATNLVYTFTRTGDISGNLTVNYTIGGTATNGTDYAAILSPVIIPAGQATATVTVDPTPDADVEADETVVITVIGGTGYTVGSPSVATGTITNDDTDITCALAPTSVNENSGTAMVYTCTRTGVTASALAIPFTLGGTATFTTDYTVGGNTSGVTNAGGTLTFTAGSATATVTATPVADGVNEPDETVIVTFASGATWDVIPNPTVLTGTIVNDDQEVSVAVAPASVTEDGVTNLVYTFTRATTPALLANTLTINFTTTGTATAGSDYTQTSTGTVTFAAGSATATVTVDPTADTVVEPDETVILTVTAGAGYTPVAPLSATGTITNDDTTYTIQFIGITGAASGAGREGNPADAGETIATFRVFRNGVNSPAGNVDVSTVPASGTATAGAPNTTCQPGQDYTSDGRTIVFPAGGDLSEDFTIRICRDLVFELTETFDAQLTNPVGGFLGAPAVATATILDDDAAPTLSINDVTVNENAGTATLTVTQSFTSSLNTTFSFSTGAVGDTATPNVDYSSTSSTGTIPAGSTTASITIPIIDDNFDEPNETFTVTLGNSPTNATINDGIGIVTITDNEPNTQFSVNNVVQIEGNPSPSDPNVASTSAFNFRITRTGDAQASETVCFETVDGDIENPAINPNPAVGGPGGTIPSNLGVPDYTSRVAGPTNCVTFTQGGPSVITVPVIVYGDSVNEFDESFTLRLISVNGVTNPLDQNNNPRITDALGLGVIQNDDGAPSISLSVNGPLVEGNTPSVGGSFTFTVTRTGSTSNPVTASWATSTGSGTTAATAGTACAADNQVDFITSSGTITIPANSASATFTVPYCGDLYDENNESFSATLSNPSNGVIGTATATATINDDDATPIISVSDVSVCEPETGTVAAVFTITRTGLSYLTSTVNVNTVDGTATTTDNDYVGILTPGGQVVTFNPTETTKTVPVTVNGDTKFETDETFTLQIVGTATNAIIDPGQGADPIGLGVIVNSGAGCTGDAAPSFAAGPVIQNEGTAAGNAPAPFFVRITRTGTTQVPATLTYSTASTSSATGGASCSTAGVDYITVTNSVINFPAGGFTPLTTGGVYGGAQGANFVDVPVQVCQDATFENNETFNVTLAATAFATINPTGSPALVTITNDDGLAFAIRNPGPEGAEGNTGSTTAFTFTIDRVGDSSVASTVCYQTVAGTATEGVDYTGLTAGAANCVTFAAGVNSMNVPVTVIGDNTPEADETFFLRLLSATAGTIPNVGTGDRVATINNDDGPFVPPTGKEGDVVDAGGQPAGDGVLLANDVSVLRNFVLGTATPATPSQFQRADINGTCGDAAINAADVTVARNWLLNSTPLPDACGPTAAARPEASEDRPDVVGRIIRAVNTNGTAGNQVTVSFQLDSQGDEASASFTINWNPAVLTYVSAALGNGVPTGTNLGQNTTQTAQGRLGILLDSTNTYATGTRQILTVTFNVAAAPGSVGTWPITFSGTPTAQSVSSANGTLLATTYESGNVVITTTAAGVRVGGRVTTASGQALRNATVVLTDAAGNKRTVTTGSFGIYSFDDVEVGQSYVVGVQSKRYRFGTRIVNVTDSLADVDFVGQE